MQLPNPIGWTPAGGIRLLDQTLLPSEERYLELETIGAVAEAIASLRVRGAPLIGIAAAMGVTLATRTAGDEAARLEAVRAAAATLGATRPTAVNLHWALRRMVRRAEGAAGAGEPLAPALRSEAQAIWDEDRLMCDRIGALGAELVPAGATTVATICNAGALATGGIGTALAPIYHLQRLGRAPRVVVPETRPLLQGSRLTAWELSRAGVSCTIVADGAVPSRLRLGDVGCALVGADRIAANGDVANKVGTYGLALAARAHGVPLYVLAPSSTVDLSVPDGAAIPIELRAEEEVTGWRDMRAAASGVPAWNPAFDVTPAELVTAIVTDRGVVPPGQLARLMD